AKFFSAMSFFDPHNSHEKTFLGECAGSICKTPQAKFEAGIPVSSVFLVDNETEVFSQMPKTTKNQISHRGKSAQQMIDFLEKYFD
ncbi:MAG: non-canonical purine NTP pyrophosphatase, partial [Candidatus Peregrinibacteria bacterium]|nr:non-canonical purine NTP pyrophosphatase [Candidatus Peregrinibacteria bacterium]